MSIFAAPLNRALINIKGKDSAKLIQGMISQDIRILYQKNQILDQSLGKQPYIPLKTFDGLVYPAITGNFLNAKGKSSLDALIVRNDDDSFIVDCSRHASSIFTKQFMMHKLKMDCSIKNISTSFNTYAIWQLPSSISPTDFVKSIAASLQSASPPISYLDPRFWRLGGRILAPPKISLPPSFQLVSEDDYHSFRIQMGIPCDLRNPLAAYYDFKPGSSTDLESPVEGASFPYQLNSDWLGGISLSKGCYIGQELTTRTFHSGTVRKRLFVMHNLPKNANIQPRNKLVLPRVTASSAKATVACINEFSMSSVPSVAPVEESAFDVDSPDVIGEILEVSPDGSSAIVSVSWRRVELKHRSQYLALAKALKSVEMSIESHTLIQDSENDDVKPQKQKNIIIRGISGLFAPVPYALEGVGGEIFANQLTSCYAGL